MRHDEKTINVIANVAASLSSSESMSRKTTTEQQPLMRSVSLMPFTSGPIGISPLNTSPLHAKKTLTELNRSNSVSPNNYDEKLSRNGVSARKKAISTIWNVLNSSLEVIPDDFPLERTSRYLPGANACTVAARVCDCLRLNSIEAVYDNEKAKAKCMTSDFVFFRVRLFSGYNDGVVIEVQRRKGNSTSFNKACRAVLDAAEGADAFEPEIAPFIKCPVVKMACLKPLVDNNLQSFKNMKDAENAISDSEALLLVTCHDAHVLALESLVIVTNPQQCSLDTCIAVSMNVLSDSSVIRQAIASLIEYGSLRNEDESYDDKDSDGNSFSERMRTLALSVLSNVLCVLSKNGTLLPIIQEQEDWFTNSLLPILIDDVKNAEYRSYDAYLSAKSLISLVQSSLVIRQRCLVEGAVTALTEAVEIGSLSHFILEQEAIMGLRALQCSC